MHRTPSTTPTGAEAAPSRIRRLCAWRTRGSGLESASSGGSGAADRDSRKGPYTRLSVTVTGMSCCVVMLAMLVGCMASLVLKYVPNWCRTLGVKNNRLRVRLGRGRDRSLVKRPPTHAQMKYMRHTCLQNGWEPTDTVLGGLSH